MPRRLKCPRRVIDTMGVEVVDRPEPTVDEMVELFRRMDTSARWHFRRRIARILVTRPVPQKPAQQSVAQSDRTTLGLRKDLDLSLRKRPKKRKAKLWGEAAAYQRMIERGEL